jgi:transcription initiation factor TFIID subunit 5
VNGAIQDGASVQQIPFASSSSEPNGQPVLTRPKPSDTIDNVLEFLYRQGYDKAYKTFQEEIAAVKDNEKPSQEAIFRAPGPVSLDNHLKRNIPQATTISASAQTEAITPEFIAQAKHIVERLSKQEGAKEADAAKGKESIGGNNISLLDPGERVIGYKRFRHWVENSLDHWRVSNSRPPQKRADVYSPNSRLYCTPSSCIPFSTLSTLVLLLLVSGV